MALLHIYDSSDSFIRETAWRRAVPDHIAADNPIALVAALDDLVKAGSTFDRVLFETHGAPGLIAFGTVPIDAGWLLAAISNNYTQIVTANAKVLFNGCNVAEGAEGWKFLYAAAKLFLTPGGGQVIGQTSVGWGNPISGHVIHFWGDTRSLLVDFSGRVVERFES